MTRRAAAAGAARARGLRRAARLPARRRRADRRTIDAALRSAGEVESVAVRGAAVPTSDGGRAGAAADPGRPRAARRADEAGRASWWSPRTGWASWPRGADDPALGRGERSDLPAGRRRCRSEVIAARMTPVGEVFDRFPRAGARPGPRPRQADPVRRRGRGDRARPRDPRRDRRSAAAPAAQRGRSRDRAARGAARRRGSRPRGASCSRPRASGTAWRSG